MHKYFPSYNDVDFNKLTISDIGRYSISKPHDSESIIEIILKYFKTKNKLKKINNNRCHGKQWWRYYKICYKF
jgi:hypothetical protein